MESTSEKAKLFMSPLAEGRELKSIATASADVNQGKSPLAEGRELKFVRLAADADVRHVAPRGGA